MKKYLKTLFVLVLGISVSCTEDNGISEPETATLKVDSQEITISGDNVRREITFTCDGSWEAATDSEWIKLETVSGPASSEQQYVFFTPEDNTAGKERTGIVEITAKNAYAAIMITQIPTSDNSISNLFTSVMEENFSKVRICAHRANTYSGIFKHHYPENSIPAIEHCIALGIDMAEIDVRKTKDGVLVCLHDSNIKNVTNGSGEVASMTYAEVCQYDMKSREKDVVSPGVKIPTLEEMLLACKDRIWVNLDLSKTTIPAREIMQVIEKTGMLDQVTCYTGSSADLGKEYYEIDNRISIHLSVSSTSAIGNIAGTKSVPLFQINTAKYWDGTSASSDLSNAIRKRGYCTFSNLLNYDKKERDGNIDALKAFCDAKIDFLQTDYGDHANIVNYLKERGLR